MGNDNTKEFGDVVKLKLLVAVLEGSQVSICKV